MWILINFLSRSAHQLRRTLATCATATLVMTGFALPSAGLAQTNKTGSTPVTLDALIPDLIKADTLDKTLPLISPTLNKNSLVKSDYLFLDSPAIAAEGLVSIHLLSEIPGTEFVLLFNMTPATGEPSLIFAKSIPNLTKADIKLKAKLSKNAELLMIAKAGSRWYSVTNDVKIATKK